MLRRTLSKPLSFLSSGCLLLVALFNLPGDAMGTNNHSLFITDAPAMLKDLEPAAVPAFSDHVGIYTIIDKVILEPNVTAPERIQLWGAFATASARDRNSYDPPLRGYYFYSLTPGKEEACRKEWADLKSIAGTGQVIGFGSRGLKKGRLRKASEKSENPDSYPVDFGLVKMSRRPSDYPPVQDLRLLPAPHSPAEGAEVKAGRVTLTAGNIADTERKNARYIFEIKADSSTEQETSPPVAAGEKATKWSPNLMVKAGEKYTWRVKATDGQWTGPIASSEFTGVR